MPKLKAIYLLNEGAFDVIYGPDERRDVTDLVDVIAPLQTARSVADDPAVLADVDVILSGWGMPTMDGATSAAVLAALRGLDDEVTAIDLREVPEALARVAVQAHRSARMRVLTVVTEGYCGSCCASRLGRVDGASYARALASSTPPAAECRRWTPSTDRRRVRAHACACASSGL